MATNDWRLVKIPTTIWEASKIVTYQALKFILRTQITPLQGPTYMILKNRLICHKILGIMARFGYEWSTTYESHLWINPTNLHIWPGTPRTGCLHNWVAPCKPAPNDYFVAIFQVAPNRLKFGMSTLFVLKGAIFSRMQKIWKKLCQIHPPPPPALPLCSSRNNVEFRSLRAKTLCMCLLRYWREIEGGGGGGGGGWWTFKNVFEALPPCLWKKNTGTFFNTKRVDMPNFSWFGATWKIAKK